MTLSPTFFVVTAMAVLLTGLSKSGFGGGLGVMSVPLMSLFVDPQFAVAILMPILIVMDVIVVWRYRRHWSRDVVLTMLPGALLGLALGAGTFRWMNGDLIRLAIGGMAMLFVGLHLARRWGGDTEVKPGALQAFSLGALSGFSSFVAHAGGPPVKGYLLRQGLEKSVFVGTNTMFFFTLNALKTVSYVAMGQLSAESLEVSAILSPMLVIGIVLGVKLHGIVDQGRFTTIVFVFLAITGGKLLFDGLSLVFA
jgi:uncharacterized membrane protein YfcA